MKMLIAFMAGVIVSLLVIGSIGIRYKPIVLSCVINGSRVDVLHIYDRLTGKDIHQYPALYNNDPLGILP
jgi:hypothetical protein